MNSPTVVRPLILIAATSLAVAAAPAFDASAQDYGAMVQQQMNQMNANIGSR